VFSVWSGPKHNPIFSGALPARVFQTVANANWKTEII
jgi:hypothetical protein